MKSFISAAFLTLAVTLAAGCTTDVGADGPVVGGSCSGDKDCAHRCTKDDKFGIGMCTRTCASDRDCPGGSVCVNEDDGVCAVSCTDNKGCEDFGRAFLCKTISRKEGAGSHLVCRLP